jgi:Carboxypeptidase regulatory-like domain
MKQILTLLITCALSVASYAQIATTTSLVGTVSDSSGKIIAGARITAVNSETLDTYNAITNQDGNYRIDFVRVGTYTDHQLWDSL